MIVELLRVQCGCGNTLTGLFDNHHAAIVAGERAGWLMQSESIGGDLCPRCLGREGNAADDWRAYDESVAEQWHANIELKRERDEARAEVERLTDWADMLRLALVELDEARADLAGCIARGVKLWEYAADVTGWYDSALALVDLHEQWEAEARAEVERLKADLQTSAYVRVKRQRDEARAEVERLKAEDADMRAQIEDWMGVRIWDTNANGAIDGADELAAYAEASDLRAQPPRHSTNEHGDCPHWCEACRVERGQREASDLRALAEREAVTEDQTDSVSFRVSDILPGYASVPVAGPLTDDRGFEVFEVRKGGDDE